MRQKKWKEKIGGNSGLIIIGAFIVLSVILAADHLFNLPQLLSGAPPEQFKWGEVVFDLGAIFCIGLISFTLVRKSEAERREVEQIHWRERNKAQEYLNIAGVILVTINAKQKVTLINRKGCKILGYEEEEITGKNWFDHFLPEWDRERVRATFIRLMPGGQKAADYFENPILTKSGEERIIAWHNTLLADERGNITGTLSSGEDITERKKAEEELKESEERFRQLAENIDQVFWLTDWDAKRLLYVNPAYERLYGRSCQSAYDDRMSWQDVIHPEDRAQVREAFARSADLSQYIEAEYRIVHDDGTVRWVLDRSYPIRDKYGRVFRFASVAEDITERKKAEEALRENEERLKLVLEGAELGSWDQNMETGEVVRNRRWVEMLGYTLEEIDSHADAWKELIHPDDLPIVNRIVEDHEAGRTPFFRCEHRMRTKSGEWKWILNCGKIIQWDSDGKPVRATGTHTDITERKRAEEVLKKSVQLLRDTGEMAKVGGWELDLSTKEVSWTEEVGRIHGVEPGYKPKLEEAMNFYAPESRPALELVLKKAAETGEPYDLESLFIPSGSKDKIWVRSLGRAIYSGGKIVKLSGTFQNIDKYKRAEEALRESEAKLKDAQVLGRIGSWEFDVESQEIIWSDQTYKLYDRDLALGPPTTEEESTYYSQEQALKLREYARCAIEEGMDFKYDLEANLPSGRHVIYSAVMQPIKDTNGRVVKLFGTVQDITERKRAEKALRESEESYRLLADNVSDVIWAMDLNFKFTYFSPSIKEALGYTPEEIICKRPDEVITPASYELIKKVIAEEMEIEMKGEGDLLRSRTVEVEEVRKDGTTFWVEIKASFLRDADNKAIGILGITRDIAGRKQAEKALQEERNKLQAIIDSMEYGLTIQDRDYNIIFQNEALKGLFGNQLGEKCYQAYEFRDKICDGCPVRMAWADGKPHTAERKIVWQSGEIMFWENTANPIRDARGEIVACLEIARNITERKKAGEEIRTERDKLESVTRNIGVGLAIISRDYQTVWANEVLKQIFGEVEGKLCFQTYNLRKDICPGCGVREVFEQGKDVSVHEQVGKDKHGNTIWSQIIATPVKDKDGNITAAMEVVVPITERKKAEERLTRFNECFLRFGADPIENINHLTAFCGELMGATCALYNRLDKGILCSWGQWNTPPDFKPMDNPAGHICYDVITRGSDEIMVIHNLPETQYAKTDPNVMAYKLQTYIGRAVKFGEDYVGSLCVVYQDDFSPSEDDKRFMNVIASAIGVEERRKEAEEALRTSEEKYRAIVENATDQIFTLDRRCRFLAINKTAAEISRKSVSEMVGKSVLQIFPKETAAQFSKNIEEVFETGQSKFIEERMYVRGKEFYNSTTLNPIKDDKRNVIAVTGIVRDITERKKAEEALRESEQRYRGVVDNIGIGVSLISPSLEILFLNKQMKKWFPNVDISKEAICYRAFNSPPREEACSYCPTNKTLQDGRVHESITETPTGEKVINYRVVSSPIKDTQGKVITAIEMVEDITEKKRLQEQLIQTEKLAAVGTLAYGIAHEFNNILAGMMANAELGLITRDPKQIKDCFEIIVDNSHRASSITNNLLAFTRHKEARKELVDITESLKSVLAITHRELEKHNIEILEKFKPVPKIYCDPGQFSEVFLNMITNARDAMHPKGGILTIQVESAGDCIRIIFKDTGCGIPEEIKGRIFEPFVTTKGALGRSEVPGTGLGLFLTYGIINGYKGKIEVESKIGKGTKFTILISVSKNQPRELLLDTRIESSKETEKKLKILLVDDEKAITLGLKKFLESKGHKVSTSLRAKEGLEIFRKGRFDLVLSDITIPDMDGIELIKKVKEKDQGTKVIVITGHLQKEKEEKAREAGADEVLIKPFKNELLYQTISKVIV